MIACLLAQSLGMAATDAGGVQFCEAQPTKSNTGKSLRIIEIWVFGLAFVCQLRLLYFGAEWGVATVQLNRTTPLLWQLYNETKCFHVVIIANDELIVNHKKAPKSGAFLVVLEYYFLEVAV